MKDHTRMLHLQGAAEIEPKLGPVVSDFAAFAADVQQWQRETFPGGSAIGAVNHLLEEAGELADELERHRETGDDNALGLAEEEAADVLLLLIAVAGLVGFDLLAAARTKMVKNRQRIWESTPNRRGYRKHIDQAEDDA